MSRVGDGWRPPVFVMKKHRLTMTPGEDLNRDKPIPLGDQVYTLVDRPELRILTFEILLCHPTGLATDISNIDRHARTYQFWVQFTYGS
jgi:hypothetical protein